MANEILNASIQLRYDLEANWNEIANTYIPLTGEACVTIDGEYKGQVKFGDGISTWGEINYAGGIEELKNYISQEEFDEVIREIRNTVNKERYEVFGAPVGTLVNIEEDEIRIMCPEDTEWTKQGTNISDPNTCYMGLRIYAPDGAFSFKEGNNGEIIDQMYTFDNDDLAGTDEFGRRYSICWLALATYDEETKVWTYLGKNSTVKKYAGWTYVIEWYNEAGMRIASDGIRINLSNERSHNTIEPYYMASINVNKLAQDEADLLILYGGSAIDNI